jgi:signal transduction histidine kinase
VILRRSLAFSRTRPEAGERLLDRYVGRFGSIVEHSRTEAALRAEKQAAEMAARAAQAAMAEAVATSRAKSAFLASVTHEFRTPLNAIIGFSEVIQSQLAANPAVASIAEYAGDIQSAGRHLLALINDVLDLARAEAGKLDLEEEPSDIGTIAQSCIAALSAKAAAKSLQVACAIPPQFPPLLADQRKLRQILANLISNAVKFTPDGGRVEIGASIGGAGEAVLAVADTGIGIAPENLEKALTPFWQADGHLARTYEGAGIGLPLAKALIERHGATIDIASAPGSGTTVFVRFPKERVLNREVACASGKTGGSDE